MHGKGKATGRAIYRERKKKYSEKFDLWILCGIRQSIANG